MLMGTEKRVKKPKRSKKIQFSNIPIEFAAFSFHSIPSLAHRYKHSGMLLLFTAHNETINEIVKL
jgi:hypothetical protein